MTIEPITSIQIDLPIRSAEQILQDISASYDSVRLIAELVENNQHSLEIDETVLRNVRHLRGCLTLVYIQENATNADKIAFSDSVALGDSWLAIEIT